MIKIAVPDTWGDQELHETYKAAFPKARFIGHELLEARPLDGPAHPHGPQVASRILLPLIDEDVELHFIRFIGTGMVAAEALMLKKIAEIQPDIVSNSWGQNRLDGRLDAILSTIWRPWVSAEAGLRKTLGYLMLFAAGNVDTGGEGYPDVGYPMRMMRDTIVVGAMARNGEVTSYSSDGKQVVCVDLGHRVYVMNPHTGEWELASGTSFAVGDTAGLMGWLLVHTDIETHAQALEWIKANVTAPEDVPVPHVKFGYGSTADEYMRVTKGVHAYSKAGVPTSSNPLIKVTYFDYSKIN